MRSFTKKNVPYNESLYHLLYNPTGNANIAGLITALNSNNFQMANKELINLSNNVHVSQLINQNRGDIQNVISGLAGMGINGPITVGNFTNPAGAFPHFSGGVPNVDFPNVNVNLSILPNLNSIHPQLGEINNVLSGAAGINNNMNLMIPPFGLVAQTVNNIAVLLVLKQLLKTAKLRSQYENLFSFNVDTSPAGGPPTNDVRINHFIYDSALGTQSQRQNGDAFTTQRASINRVYAPVAPPIVSAGEPNLTAYFAIGGAGAGLGTGPGGITDHIFFNNAANPGRWIRHMSGGVLVVGTTYDNIPGYILISAREAKLLVGEYINNAATLVTGAGAPAAFFGLTPVARQGVRILNYIQRHYSESLHNIVVASGGGSGDADRGYRVAKLPIINTQGLYCAFCETPVQNGRDGNIEHKLPKSVFPTEALDWENFVFSCVVCNLAFKQEKIIDEKHLVSGVPANRFPSNKFVPAGGGPKDYISYRNNSLNEVLWPDNKHPAVGGNAAHNRLSFEALDYLIVYGPGGGGPVGLAPSNHLDHVGIGLLEIELGTLCRVGAHIPAPPGALHTYQIDLVNLTGGIPDHLNVQVITQNRALLPANIAGPGGGLPSIGIQASADHIRDICGLNQISARYWNDQRVVGRTKSWLNAMKQVRVLEKFRTVEFRSLYDYYDRQLHPYNIQKTPPGAAPLVPNTFSSSMITGFRKNFNTNPVAMGIRRISNASPGPGFIAVVNENMPVGEVEIDIGPNLANSVITSPNLQIDLIANGIPAGTIAIGGQTCTSGRIVGNVTTAILGGVLVREISGSIDILASGSAQLTNRVIFFKRAQLNWVPPAGAVLGETRINMDRAVIPVNSGAPYRPLLLEWDQKRDQLLKFLNRADKILLSYIWENILDMVRLGGFYSTWVRTFQQICNPLPPALPAVAARYDIDLVRRLEMKAQENPEDPYQFHGTDSAEIIQSL